MMMIRAGLTKLASHARRANGRSVSFMSAAAVTTSRDTECAIGVAAGLTFLGIGFACADERTANCDQSKSETAQEESGNSFRTTSASNIKAQGCDMNKSERAFAFAMANGLFNAYEDGADNYEYDLDADEEEVQTSDGGGDGPAMNAVVEKFVSFSPASAVNIQPRMSIRHTNRKANEEENVLATSRWKDTFPDEANDARTDEEKKDVIVQRINTVRREGLGQNQVYTKQMYFYQAAQVKDFMRDRFRLFALPSSETLGKEMALLLDTSLNAINIGAFTDGETSVKVEDRVRGKDVFLVCSTISTDAVMELLLTVSALQRSSAKRVCVVIPYYGYSRQDRRTGFKREPIAAADMAKMLEEMGVDSVICVDLHNPLVKGFFSPIVPVDHLMPGPVAAAYFYEELFTGDEEDPNEVTGMEKSEQPKEDPKITIVAAHENQVFRANGFRSALQKLSGSSDIRVALVSTSTDVNVHNKTKTSTVVGDVEGRQCIIVDDIINTGSTLKGAIEAVHKSGASEVYAWATHGVFHNPENNAPEMFQEIEGLKYMLISNSVTNNRDLPPKIRTLSIAPLLAEAVVRSLHSESIMTMLDVNKPKTRTWSK